MMIYSNLSYSGNDGDDGDDDGGGDDDDDDDDDDDIDKPESSA